MTNNLPWFRLYSEILSDRKITRICARTGQPKYAVIGFWASLLAIANEATVRGLLLISNDIPLDKEEIFLECGIDCGTGEVLLQEFINLNMIELDEDGMYSICHWENRQFASDNSTERVRRHRERKRTEKGPEPEAATPEPKNDTPSNKNGNNPSESNDTPQETKRFSNVIDTESETESDITPNGVSGSSPPLPENPQNQESGSESEPLPKKPEPEKPGPKTIVREMFLELTHLPEPKPKSSTDKMWWGKFQEILTICNKDPAQTMNVMGQVVSYMRTEGLVISGPQSIVNLCRSVVAGQTLNGANRNGQKPKYQPTRKTGSGPPPSEATGLGEGFDIPIKGLAP